MRYRIGAQATALLLVGFALLWHAAAAASPAAPVPADIHIITAIYGGSLGADGCDVQELMMSRCDGRARCSVPLDDSLCTIATDRSQALIPRLEVTYRCGTVLRPRVRSAEPPGRMTLSCLMSAFSPPTAPAADR